MANWLKEKGEVVVKIAIVGQGGAGKASILNQLASRHGQASVRTSVVSEADVSRTEYLLADPHASGAYVRVRIFAISGEPAHQAAQQLVLSQADGIVFVADCDPRHISASRGALIEVISDAAAVGTLLNDIAVAVQYHRSERYPNFNPVELDDWLGIKGGKVSRHVTRSDETQWLDVAVEDVVEKVVDQLTAPGAAA